MKKTRAIQNLCFVVLTLFANIAYGENLISALPIRCVGPAQLNSNGRVVSLAIYEKDPSLFFIGSASGGVWKTENAGMTFTPIFDREGSSSIGCVAVSQTDPNLLWVGTGEATHRNDVGWGDGVYKSSDGGKSWLNMGLKNSFSISKIAIDPHNEGTVLVGALGSAWGYGGDRGVYKSSDGGKTWRRVLYVDEKAGVADMAMDPKNPHNVLAAVWDNIRTPHSMTSGGPSSGLYLSRDEGEHWHLVRGLPTPVGRIGLSYFAKNPQIVDAIVEAHGLEGGLYRSSDGGENWIRLPGVVLDRNEKPIERKNHVTREPEDPLADRPFYFSVVRQDPVSEKKIFVGTTHILLSTDAGKSFPRVSFATPHYDHHDLWIDPAQTSHIIIAEDGGAAQSFDGGANWQSFTSGLALGQLYSVAYDMRKPYWIYGGLQDNGCFACPTQTSHHGITNQDGINLGGGDGMHGQVDPVDWKIAYVESQDGRLNQVNQVTGENGGRSPGDDEELRRNWTTPIIISPWNSKTLYYGANLLFKSTDRAETWKAISPDLTKNNPEWQKPNTGMNPDASGAEVYDTIFTISESPMKEGLIYVGTDDGNVQMTRDDGVHWTDVTSKIPDLPKNTWVSRVTASRFAEGRVYATFDGHRSDDFNSYIYVSEDYGQTWRKLNNLLLPRESCYAILEGLHNPDLLFLGTEFGLYISMDRGQTWTRYQNNNFPTVSVYDITIQPREEDLIIGTHGRSVWTMPIGALDELTKENREKDVYFARPSDIYLLGFQTQESIDSYHGWFSPNTQPGALFCYYLRHGSSGAQITISDPAGHEKYGEISGTANEGLNAVRWTYSLNNSITRPGDYRVTLSVQGNNYTQTLHVEEAFGDSK